MTISQIASTRMCDDTLKKVNDLVANFSLPNSGLPQNAGIVQAVCWPDAMKYFGIAEMNDWHFVNRPYSPDGFPIPTGVDFPMQVQQADRMIWEFEDTVNANLNEKLQWALQYALIYLLHLVGDIHQPLHTIELFSKDHPTGDGGGNDIIIHVDGTTIDLHSVWDTICWQFPSNYNQPLSNDARSALNGYADKIVARYKDTITKEEENVWNSTAWSVEGYDLAVKYAYAGVHNGTTLTSDYLEQCKGVAERRIVLAGMRLAHLLDQVFYPVAEPKEQLRTLGKHLKKLHGEMKQKKHKQMEEQKVFRNTFLNIQKQN